MMEEERGLFLVYLSTVTPPLRAEEEGVVSSLVPSPTCETPRYLRPLLDLCFRQFEEVVSSHRTLLGHLAKAKQSYKGTAYVISVVQCNNFLLFLLPLHQ